VDLEILTGEARWEDEDLFTQQLHTTLPAALEKVPRPHLLFHSLGTIASLPFIAQTLVLVPKLGIACAPAP
jgi:hypothetical protein